MLIEITEEEEKNELCQKAIFQKIEAELQIDKDKYDLQIIDRVLDKQLFRIDLVKNIFHIWIIQFVFFFFFWNLSAQKIN